MYYQEACGSTPFLLLVELRFAYIFVFLRWSLQISHKQIQHAEILIYIK